MCECVDSHTQMFIVHANNNKCLTVISINHQTMCYSSLQCAGAVNYLSQYKVTQQDKIHNVHLLYQVDIT